MRDFTFTHNVVRIGATIATDAKFTTFTAGNCGTWNTNATIETGAKRNPGTIGIITCTSLVWSDHLGPDAQVLAFYVTDVPLDA